LKFRSISVDPDQAESRAARRLAETGAPIGGEPGSTADYREGKTVLRVASKKGDAFGLCASLSEEYVCCNVHVLASVSNCPYDCSYCFLQNYLTDTATSVVGDVAALVNEVREKTAREPWRFFRVGTWELGDSLALENQTGQAEELVGAIRALSNCALELKTKSANVGPLLNLDHGGRVVVSWTMNPRRVIETEELKTAGLGERLEAMSRAAKSGYLIGAHFDPIIIYEGCEEEYERLVKQVFEAAPPERVAWVSVGSIRFNPEMKRKMEVNFPKSRITSAEMVLGGDGKTRYVKPRRVGVYSRIHDAIRKYGGDGPLVYLCMERKDVWEKVLGYAPRSASHLDYLITESLYRRFPGLVHQAPVLDRYEDAAR